MWNKIKDFGPEKITRWIYMHILTPPFHKRKFGIIIFIVVGTIVFGILQHYCFFRFEIENSQLRTIFSTLIQSLITIGVVFIALDIIKIGWELVADTIVYIFMLALTILIFMIFTDIIIEQRFTAAILFLIITALFHAFYLSIKIAQNRTG